MPQETEFEPLQQEIELTKKKPWHDAHHDGRRLERLTIKMERNFHKEADKGNPDNKQLALMLRSISYAIQTKHSLANKLEYGQQIDDIKTEMANMKIHMGLNKMFGR